MHPDKFGDSYDIVKQSILEWLLPCGTWAVHPMFAYDYRQTCPSFAGEYSAFLNAPLLTTEPLPRIEPGRRVRPRWDAYMEERRAYFENARQWDNKYHLFLDPDIGLWLPPKLPRSREEPQHLMAEELLDIARARPDNLTLIFDQGFSRNLRESKRRTLTQKKLIWLKKRGVNSIMYFSHANFVLASANPDALDYAKRTLVTASSLTHRKRIVEI